MSILAGPRGPEKCSLPGGSASSTVGSGPLREMLDLGAQKFPLRKRRWVPCLRAWPQRLASSLVCDEGFAVQAKLLKGRPLPKV